MREFPPPAGGKEAFRLEEWVTLFETHPGRLKSSTPPKRGIPRKEEERK